MTPAFWYNGKPAPMILRPLAFLYGVMRRCHVVLTVPVRTPLATICVGNLTVGGTGKTPVVQALRDIMASRHPVILTRGYGGTLDGPVQVHDDHTVAQVGDEALLHAEFGPVVMAKNRLDGARFIATAPDPKPLVIMDDGLQNRTLSAPCNMLVVDGAVGFGNGALLPAGPLREPVVQVLARVHAVVMVGDDIHNVRAVFPDTLPVFTAHMVAHPRAVDLTRRYLAFCGIGRPDKFFKTLEDHHISVVARRIFSDHHAYTKQDIAALLDDAARMQVGLICTSKDMIKVRALTHAQIATLPITCVFDHPQAVHDFIVRQTGLS